MDHAASLVARINKEYIPHRGIIYLTLVELTCWTHKTELYLYPYNTGFFIFKPFGLLTRKFYFLPARKLQ